MPKPTKEDVGCWSVVVILFGVLVGALLWCGHSSDKRKEALDLLRADCEKAGGKTYYQDLGKDRVRKLVCVQGGRE